MHTPVPQTTLVRSAIGFDATSPNLPGRRPELNIRASRSENWTLLPSLIYQIPPYSIFSLEARRASTQASHASAGVKMARDEPDEDGAVAGATPMMAQYLSLKRQAEGCLLFYRMGDFSELFFDDVRIAAACLPLPLTAREMRMAWGRGKGGKYG